MEEIYKNSCQEFVDGESFGLGDFLLVRIKFTAHMREAASRLRHILTERSPRAHNEHISRCILRAPALTRLPISSQLRHLPNQANNSAWRGQSRSPPGQVKVIRLLAEEVAELLSISMKSGKKK